MIWRGRCLSGLALFALLAVASACLGDSTEPDSAVMSVDIAPDTATLELGETRQLTATLRDAAGRVVDRLGTSWSTSNDAVAIVSQGGLVAAVGAGQATITASYEGTSDQSQITVRAPCQVSNIAVTPAEFTVAMGATVALTATVSPGNCTDLVVSWRSGDPSIAEVSEDGVVTGIWPGATVITAAINGLVGVSAATVRPPYPEGRITFSLLPVDLDRIVGFTGLGNLNVLPEDHGGFLTPPQEPTIPVYAPADGWIEGLIYDSVPAFGLDLTMRIRYSTTIVTNYGHLSDFATEVWEAAGALVKGVDKRANIPVSVGQVVAWAGRQGGFDFYVGNDELELQFINPSRYPYPWLKAGYSFDYFAEPELSQLLAVTIRQDEPRGGKVDFDIPGKIIGNWFLEGTEGWGTNLDQLAIVYDFIDGTKVAIADGSTITDVDREPSVYWVEGNSPRPENVGLGEGLVKYEVRRRWFQDAMYSGHVVSDVLGTFLVEMFEPGKIRVEMVPGKLADEVTGFSGAARVYER
jgi:hypothetical protein